MSVVVRSRHYFLGLSDELAVRNGDQSTDETDLDISAEARVKLYPRWSLSSARDHGCDQLFHCRKHLVWSTEHRERLRFEASGPITDAELCPFAEESACTVLSVSEPGLLTMYTTDGDLQEHSLKLPVRSLWPTSVGVLVEGFEGSPAQLATHLISGPQPVRAVHCAHVASQSHANAAAAGAATYAWENERVLFTHACTPFAVTSAASVSAVRIWCLKAFPEGELAPPPPPVATGAAAATPRAGRPVGTPVVPPSALSSKSRVRTPEGHTQPHVFTAYRSGEPGTASTWAQPKARMRS
jgi:hypothetical protein